MVFCLLTGGEVRFVYLQKEQDLSPTSGCRPTGAPHAQEHVGVGHSNPKFLKYCHWSMVCNEYINSLACDYITDIFC
jgi:hypothetical protein